MGYGQGDGSSVLYGTEEPSPCPGIAGSLVYLETDFEVLGTFFYRKKKALLPLAKASHSACRPLCRCVGSKPPKKLLYEDKTLGRCPKPYPPFEKGGAKTFIFASLFINKNCFSCLTMRSSYQKNIKFHKKGCLTTASKINFYITLSKEPLYPLQS
jgi:hypothetical protein